MFDIDFFKKAEEIKKKIVSGKLSISKQEIFDKFEKLRSKKPFVFNIETTNYCNMTCKMCPRTSLMNRKLEHMKPELFEKIISQLEPYNQVDLDNFWKFITDEYNIPEKEKSENAFYFYTISKSVTLHGYGEPLVDPYLLERIKVCAKYNIPNYFSCVPANIHLGKLTALMKAGAGVIKFSMDALDDETSKTLRGKQNNFNKAYEKILQLLEIKKNDPSISTKIVLTMISFSSDAKQKKLEEDFLKLWSDKSVYAYIKSQDNRWYYEDDEEMKSKNHYEKQYCEYPFTSLTIMADGSVVPCTQDYNTEMTFGNASKQTLEEIWNGEPYRKFRWGHITGEFAKDTKCVNRCDQKLVIDRLNTIKDTKENRFVDFD